MICRQLRLWLRPSLTVMILSLIVLSPSAARAGFVVTISANTTAINGLNGSFDLQLNPGGLGSLPVTATITNFLTDGTGLSLNTTDGNVSGTLIPGPLTINNTLAFNDLLENITFGSQLSFTLTLSGPGVTSPNLNDPGTSFGLSLYDVNFNPLLTTDPAGTVVTANLNPNGSTSIQTFSSDSSGGASVVTATTGPVATPAPSSLVLVILGVLSLGGYALVTRNRCSGSPFLLTDNAQ